MRFTPVVDSLLDELQIARVAADPAPAPGASEPSGWRGLSYYSPHNPPRIYYSPYNDEALAATAERLVQDADAGSQSWCIFDNTAAFAATRDALHTRDLVRAML
jgi:uncharacterized protein YecE (DUF72 family)